MNELRVMDQRSEMEIISLQRGRPINVEQPYDITAWVGSVGPSLY
jgi:hypothetical protein